MDSPFLDSQKYLSQIANVLSTLKPTEFVDPPSKEQLSSLVILTYARAKIIIEAAIHRHQPDPLSSKRAIFSTLSPMVKMNSFKGLTDD